MSIEKLKEARAALEAVTREIEAYNIGDRPPSPPVRLLREERRLKTIADWYEHAEKQRIEREAKQK